MQHKFVRLALACNHNHRFMTTYLCFTLLFTLALKGTLVVSDGLPFIPAMLNQPYTVTHSADKTVFMNGISVSMIDERTIALASTNNDSVMQATLSWEPQSIKERVNCIAFSENSSNPLVFCVENDVLYIERNHYSDTMAKENVTKIDVDLLDDSSMYIGDGSYLSILPLAEHNTLDYATGLLAMVLLFTKKMFGWFTTSFGLTGFFMAVLSVRAFSFIHDIDQARLHVKRVLGIPYTISRCRLVITTSSVVVCTILILRTISHLDQSVPLEASWSSITFCFGALLFRLYMQGSKIISVEGVILLTILILFVCMKDAVAGYFFYYFGFCAVLIGLVRYVSAHVLVRFYKGKTDAKEESSERNEVEDKKSAQLRSE